MNCAEIFGVTEPYYCHHTMSWLWRIVHLIAVLCAIAGGIYSIMYFDLVVTNLAAWIAGFYLLVLLSNFRIFYRFLKRPLNLIEYIWYPILDFAADRNGLYFSDAPRKARNPAPGEIVHITWDRVKSINYETRRGFGHGRPRALVFKIDLTPKEKRILNKLNHLTENINEIQFGNGTPFERLNLEALEYLRTFE